MPQQQEEKKAFEEMKKVCQAFLSFCFFISFRVEADAVGGLGIRKRGKR